MLLLGYYYYYYYYYYFIIIIIIIIIIIVRRIVKSNFWKKLSWEICEMPRTQSFPEKNINDPGLDLIECVELEACAGFLESCNHLK